VVNQSETAPARLRWQQGRLERERGDAAAAMASFREAIGLQANFVPAYHQLALVLQSEGRDDEAIGLYEEAVTRAPTMAALHCNLASLRQFRGDTEQAIAGFQQAVVLDPGLFLAHAQLGKALAARGDFEPAVAAFQVALRLRAQAHDIWLELGVALSKLQRYEEALHGYEQALAIKPDFEQAYLSMGVTLFEQKKYHLSLLSYDRALALKPDYALAFYNQGLALGRLNRCAEAAAAQAKALERLPDYADAHWMESINRLLLGDYKNAWAMYEWRWQRTGIEPEHQQHFAQPLWLGQESLLGKTILLHAEQGLGDAVQFCRYAELVAALGAKVLLQIYPAVKPVLFKFPGVAQLLVRGELLPDFDYHCPLLSLPLAFQTELASIPAKTPYLFSHPSRLRKWRAKLGAKTLPRVGIAWSGSPTHLNDKDRSISLEQFVGVVGPQAQFFSLQREVQERDKDTLQQHPEIAHFGEALQDFSETAALIDLMDVVVCVDTGVAHLAAAMGKPVWILLHYNPDWRWMLERIDSPWYPSARLFRQPNRDDWAGVLATVRRELTGLRADSAPV
jgi:tetratricopeptide (TPR) repeat protein